MHVNMKCEGAPSARLRRRPPIPDCLERLSCGKTTAIVNNPGAASRFPIYDLGACRLLGIRTH